MSTKIHDLAGHPASERPLLDVAALRDAYSSKRPEPTDPDQRVAFGTSGHRGSAFRSSFNEWHVWAVTQAICDYRSAQGIDGPLFLGIDSHALSEPAAQSALEVLAANGVETRIALGGELTPTPAISQAILVHNRGRETGLADGVVITPSHNPPEDGGYKYNPTNGGPADTTITAWVEARANKFLESGLEGVARIPFEQAGRADCVQEYDFLSSYVRDLANVLDLDLIRDAGLRMAVDPLGGAGVRYWSRIAEMHKLNLTVVRDEVDLSFGFMTLDWDGKIRMDPSSAWAMRQLIELKDGYDIAFGCDTDHDRHGIVTPSAGLLPTNHYLSVAIDDLLRNRPAWSASAKVGKTVVSSAMIDRVAARAGRGVLEVPVGFKWFVDGLIDASLVFGGEESAGATFNRRDGSVWTTDKDGIAAALLSAEITARNGRDPGELYANLAAELGEPFTARVEASANREAKAKLSKLSPEKLGIRELAGEAVTAVLNRAPGNDAPIGGIKVTSENGWFAARPSGTEDIYKIYGESFVSEDHLKTILAEAQEVVDRALV